MYVFWFIYNVLFLGDICIFINCLLIYFLLIELYILNIERFYVVVLLIYSVFNCGLGDCYFDMNRVEIEKKYILYDFCIFFLKYK